MSSHGEGCSIVRTSRASRSERRVTRGAAGSATQGRPSSRRTKALSASAAAAERSEAATTLAPVGACCPAARFTERACARASKWASRAAF